MYTWDALVEFVNASAVDELTSEEELEADVRNAHIARAALLGAASSDEVEEMALEAAHLLLPVTTRDAAMVVPVAAAWLMGVECALAVMGGHKTTRAALRAALEESRST